MCDRDPSKDTWEVLLEQWNGGGTLTGVSSSSVNGAMRRSNECGECKIQVNDRDAGSTSVRSTGHVIAKKGIRCCIGKYFIRPTLGIGNIDAYSSQHHAYRRARIWSSVLNRSDLATLPHQVGPASSRFATATCLTVHTSNR